MKTSWRRLSETEASLFWDCYLERFEKASPFQSYAWGQFQKALGWKPLYLVCADSELNVQSMFLGHFKPGIMSSGIVTSTGGPIGDAANWGEELRECVRVAVTVKRLYFRLRCDRNDSKEDNDVLRSQDWSVPTSGKTSGLTMELDIDKSESLLYSGLSKQWKKSLRSARNKELSVREDRNPTASEIRQLFAELESRKKLPELYSEEKFQLLFDHLGSNLLLLRCEDKHGQLLAVRIVLKKSNYAVDYLAATNSRGRKLRASYFLLWEMFARCQEEGIKTYDLGGIDPKHNEGVYHFKKGTGAEYIEQVGELDWATNKYLRVLANAAIAFQELWKKSRIGTKFASLRARYWLAGHNDRPPLRKSSVNKGRRIHSHGVKKSGIPAILSIYKDT